jgi:hypothetical protein
MLSSDVGNLLGSASQIAAELLAQFAQVHSDDREILLAELPNLLGAQNLEGAHA